MYIYIYKGHYIQDSPGFSTMIQPYTFRVLEAPPLRGLRGEESSS